MASEAQIAWAAGLFEGEGTATFSKDQRQPRLSIAMTDEDVVRRFAMIVGRGNVRRYEPYQPNRQPQWQWSVQSGPDVVYVLGLFIDYLGQRRRARAEQVLVVASEIGKPRDGGGGYYPSGRCKRGHDLSDPAHLYVHPKTGKRHCRTCRRDRAPMYREKARMSWRAN